MAHLPLAGRKTMSWFVRFALLSALCGSAAAARAAEATPAAWSKGKGLCDSGKLEEGWKALAQVEKAAGKKPLPAAYWREVLACASKADLPANALRAGKMLEDQKQATAEDRALVAKARAAVREPDVGAVIAPNEAWIARDRPNDGFVLISPICGFAFEPRNDHPFPTPVQQRTCSVRTWTPALKGKAGEQRASIVVLARVAKPNEKVEDYAKLIMPTWNPVKFAGFRCPGARCVTYGTTIPGLFGKDGDSVRLAVAFEREQPEFPGLAIEEPGPYYPKRAAGTKPYGRFRGKIMYLVMFDSASSTAERAKADYRKFLAELRVE